MQRRKMLAALGSVAVGGATAVSTGAFTSVQAQRSVNIATATDANAFLSLQATGDRATTDSNGQLVLDFDGSSEEAQGLNPDARTAFTDLFKIENRGNNNVLVAVGLSEDDVYADGSGQGHLFDNQGISGFVYKEEGGNGVGLGPTGGFGSIQIDNGGRVDLDINDGQLNGSGEVASDTIANQRTLAPGDSLSVDLSIKTSDNPTINEENNRISVLAAEPNSDRADSGEGS